MIYAVYVIVWSCVALFIATGVVTILALAGQVTLGGSDQDKHHKYLSRLLTVLIVEIVSSTVIVYAAFVRVTAEQMRGMLQFAAVETRLAPEPLGTPSARAPLATPTVVASHDFPSASPSPSGVPSATPRARKRQELQAKVYATSDGAPVAEARVEVPAGWRIIGEPRVEEVTKNGDARAWVDRQPLSGGGLVLVLRANAAPRSLFGANNWIGAVLTVAIESPSE